MNDGMYYDVYERNAEWAMTSLRSTGGDRDFVLLEFKLLHYWKHRYIPINQKYTDISPTTLPSDGTHSQVQSSEEEIFTEI